MCVCALYLLAIAYIHDDIMPLPSLGPLQGHAHVVPVTGLRGKGEGRRWWWGGGGDDGGGDGGSGEKLTEKK